MADALTVAIVGVAGTVAVSLVTMAGTVANARIQARAAERNRDREDAVRADERRAEEVRRSQEQEAELRRAEQQRLAEAERRHDAAAAAAAESAQQANADRVAQQRDVAVAFVAQTQTLYRILVSSARTAESDGAELEQRLWRDLSECLGAVMLAFDEDHARHAVAAIDALQEVFDSVSARQLTPDMIARRLEDADDHLRAFVAAARTLVGP